MSINSMIFLTAFLPVVFCVGQAVRAQNSAEKYPAASGKPCVLCVGRTGLYCPFYLFRFAANYGIGLLLGRQRDESVAAKTVLAAGILVNRGDSWVL